MRFQQFEKLDFQTLCTGEHGPQTFLEFASALFGTSSNGNIRLESSAAWGCSFNSMYMVHTLGHPNKMFRFPPVALHSKGWLGRLDKKEIKK